MRVPKQTSPVIRLASAASFGPKIAISRLPLVQEGRMRCGRPAPQPVRRPRGLPAVLRLARCVELHRLPLTETRSGRIPSARRVPDRFAFAVGHRRECGFEAAPAVQRSLSSRESREAEISDEITCPSEASRTLNELGWFENRVSRSRAFARSPATSCRSRCVRFVRPPARLRLLLRDQTLAALGRRLMPSKCRLQSGGWARALGFFARWRYQPSNRQRSATVSQPRPGAVVHAQETLLRNAFFKHR